MFFVVEPHRQGNQGTLAEGHEPVASGIKNRLPCAGRMSGRSWSRSQTRALVYRETTLPQERSGIDVASSKSSESVGGINRITD